MIVLHKFYLIYHTCPIVTAIPLSVQALGSEVNQHTVWHVCQVHIAPKLSAMECINVRDSLSVREDISELLRMQIPRGQVYISDAPA